eukprot:Lankesteria_metandrocarpae@DN8393_c0_g1_i1.p1
MAAADNVRRPVNKNTEHTSTKPFVAQDIINSGLVGSSGDNLLQLSPEREIQWQEPSARKGLQLDRLHRVLRLRHAAGIDDGKMFGWCDAAQWDEGIEIVRRIRTLTSEAEADMRSMESATESEKKRFLAVMKKRGLRVARRAANSKGPLLHLKVRRVTRDCLNREGRLSSRFWPIEHLANDNNNQSTGGDTTATTATNDTGTGHDTGTDNDTSANAGAGDNTVCTNQSSNNDSNEVLASLRKCYRGVVDVHEYFEAEILNVSAVLQRAVMQVCETFFCATLIFARQALKSSHTIPSVIPIATFIKVSLRHLPFSLDLIAPDVVDWMSIRCELGRIAWWKCHDILINVLNADIAKEKENSDNTATPSASVNADTQPRFTICGNKNDLTLTPELMWELLFRVLPRVYIAIAKRAVRTNTICDDMEILSFLAGPIRSLIERHCAATCARGRQQTATGFSTKGAPRRAGLQDRRQNTSLTSHDLDTGNRHQHGGVSTADISSETPATNTTTATTATASTDTIIATATEASAKNNNSTSTTACLAGDSADTVEAATNVDGQPDSRSSESIVQLHSSSSQVHINSNQVHSSSSQVHINSNQVHSSSSQV